MKGNSFFQNYNLSIILLVLFVLTWIAQTYAGRMEFKAEEHMHGLTPQFYGDSGYVWPWLKSTFENWQSEFLQLLTFVVLTAYFIHKGSHESKDTDDEMMALLHKIEQRIERVEQKSSRIKNRILLDLKSRLS